MLWIRKAKPTELGKYPNLWSKNHTFRPEQPETSTAELCFWFSQTLTNPHQLKQSFTNYSWYLLRYSTEQLTYLAIPLWNCAKNLQDSLRLRKGQKGRWPSRHTPNQANVSGDIRLDATFRANQRNSGYTTTLEDLDCRHNNLRLLVKIYNV